MSVQPDLGTSTNAASLEAAEMGRRPGAHDTLLFGFVPIGVLLGGAFFIPLSIMVLYSFWRMEGIRVVPDWTLFNYTNLFGSGVYARVLLKTFAISLLVTFLTIVAGYPFAYFLVRHTSPRWQQLLVALVIMPFWTSYLLRVYAWMGILGERGLINLSLLSLGIIKAPLRFLLNNNYAVTLVFIYLYLPFAVITLYAAIQKFDFNQMLAAADLGATPWQAFWEVLFPQTRQGIATAFMFIFIPMLGEYITPKLVGGTDGILISNLIVNLFRGFQLTQGAAIAFAIVFLIVILLVLGRRYLSIEELVP